MRCCYVLGAGFSRPLGLPLASELTAQVFAHATDGMNDFRPDVANGWLGLLKQLYPSCDFRRNWPDFEDLTTVLDELEQYRVDYEGTPTPQGPLQAAHLKKVLLRHLALLLCERLAACSEDGIEAVGRFVQAAHSRGEAIICFNWDLVLEVACKQVGIEVSYGGISNAGLQIAKPHGSLNLAQDSRQHLEEVRETPGKLSNVRDVVVDYEQAENVVVRAEDPEDAANRIINPFRDKMLVEPNTRKTYASGWLRLQWTRALRTVRGADEIVVIGYSLPVQDFRPRLLLQLAAVERNPQPRIVLVDPDPEKGVLARYREFISSPLEAVNTQWQNWFEGEVGM